MLEIITELSHEFGTSNYVCGGGGNTSCKDAQTLWVKPSGTTLSTLTPKSFIALDRKKLSELYQISPPSDSSERELLVKQAMERAVLPSSSGRASVEAPLHNVLQFRYVVHTHPAIVNGMTCAGHGAEICRELFPDALWLDYIDPGYTLCMRVKDEIKNYQKQHDCEPSLIFLKNHGVFVAADTPEQIRSLYADVMSKLMNKYSTAGISLYVEFGESLGPDELEAAKQNIFDAMQISDLFIADSGTFDVAKGPITPDHIVYSKSYPFIGSPDKNKVEVFQNTHGYPPQVFVFGEAVFGVADTEKGAKLALELAKDGALVHKLAQAFGGIEYLTDRAREFIENWEVESYRKKQMES